MAKHEPKKYVHVCTVYGKNFDGFNVPIGAIFGRESDTFFVSLYRNIRRGSMSVYVKTPREDWAKKPLPVTSSICRAILDCAESSEGKNAVVGSWRDPDSKRRHKRKKPTQKSELPLVEFGGKKYKELPLEMSLPDFVASRELRSITPNMRGANYEFTARMRPDRATYGVVYNGKEYIFRGTEEAEKFCYEKCLSTKSIKQEFVYNEAVPVTYNQKTQYAYWSNLDNAASGNAGTVAYNIKGWRE